MSNNATKAPNAANAPTETATFDSRNVPDRSRWVRETRFGHWFLGTGTWSRHVVEVAMSDLVRLVPGVARRPLRILDAGSGPGVSLPLLDRHFDPEEIIALDIDPREVERSSAQAKLCRCRVEVRAGDATRLDLPDESVDMVLCHQLLHHLVRQGEALAEFHRVLAPRGTLLLAESCREFILSTPVRLMFRHPSETQRSAGEYIRMVRDAGFEVRPEWVQTSTPFWSLGDWGLMRKLGFKQRAGREPTEVTLVALKRGD